MLKVELHAHTDLDPADYIRHSTRELIERAGTLGYGALAITLHDRYYDPAGDRHYAQEHGIVLMAGIERSIEGRHLLLVNYPAACAEVGSFEELRLLKRRHPTGLVVAPHAFYPIPSAIGTGAARHADLIDALEVNSMYTRWVDFNQGAIAWARTNGKPVVGNTDLHLLGQLGTTYSLVDAAPDPDAICAAIRGGRVEVRSTALPMLRAAWLFGLSLGLGAAGRLRRLAGREPAASGQDGSTIRRKAKR
ncbi:MAG: PHP domain-containing protein [Acidobacteria bacterium]|nr:PHP domain-containing protein [Acidobacteriota bacterium]